MQDQKLRNAVSRHLMSETVIGYSPIKKTSFDNPMLTDLQHPVQQLMSQIVKCNEHFYFYNVKIKEHINVGITG